jgi:hypothetical protein
MFKSIWSVPLDRYTLEQKIMEEVYMDDAIPQGKQCEEINRRIVLSALESNEISAAGGEELTKEIVDFCDFEDLSGWPIHMVKLKQKVIQKCKEMRKIEKLDREKMKKLEEAKVTFVEEYTKWVIEPKSAFYSDFPFNLRKSDDSDINDFLIHLCFTKGFWYDYQSSHRNRFRRNLEFHDSIFREVFVEEFFYLLFFNLLVGFMFLHLNFGQYEIKHHFNVYHCCTFVWSFPITFLVWSIITGFTSNAFQNLRHYYLPPKSHVLEKRKSA